MNEFEKQFQELQSFLQFEDYIVLTKRIIDLTLDTEKKLDIKKSRLPLANGILFYKLF